MTTILFIHGFPFDHLMWRHQVAALSEWRCVAPDLPGAGTAPAAASAEDYSMATYAGHLLQLLDRSTIAEVVVCGLSMGGYIAFELLRRRSERIRGVILCNTKAPGDTPQAKADRDAMAALAQQKGPEAIAEQLLPKLLSPSTFERQPNVVREIRETIARQPRQGIVGALRALRERPDSTPILQRIRVPAMVVAGADDQITPAAGMREMARAIPNADFVEIANAGHVTPLEQPRALNTALTAFLTKLG